MCDLPCHTVSCYSNWCAIDSQWTWTHRTSEICRTPMLLWNVLHSVFFPLIFLVFFVPHLYLYAVKFVSVLYALFIYCLFVVLAFPIKCNLVCIYIFMFVSANWNYWKGSKCIIHRTLLTRIHFVFTKWPNQRIFFSLDLARVRKNIFACVS